MRCFSSGICFHNIIFLSSGRWSGSRPFPEYLSLSHPTSPSKFAWSFSSFRLHFSDAITYHQNVKKLSLEHIWKTVLKEVKHATITSLTFLRTLSNTLTVHVEGHFAACRVKNCGLKYRNVLEEIDADKKRGTVYSVKKAPRLAWSHLEFLLRACQFPSSSKLPLGSLMV